MVNTSIFRIDIVSSNLIEDKRLMKNSKNLYYFIYFIPEASKETPE